jgi:hypothetical protein
MARFAEGTDVPVDRSKSEIENVLTRFGADQFMYGWKGEAAAIAFRSQGRHIRFLLPMPQASDSDMQKDRRGHRRSPSETQNAIEKEKRRRWRALCLCIKAKLESVATGIETFEESFMAHVILPNGQTVAEHAQPLIAKAYESGEMPALLPYLQ